MLETLMYKIVRALFRLEIVGDRDSLFQPQTLVIANHTALWDGFFIRLLMPKGTIFVVNPEIMRRPIFRFLIGQVEHIQIDPSNPMAARTVIRLLDAGKRVVIFPEGRISRTGSLMKIYNGTAFVAARSGATVIPVILDGLQYSRLSYLKGRNPQLYFPRVTIYICSAQKLCMPNSGTARQKHRQLGHDLRNMMERALAESFQSRNLAQALLAASKLFGMKRPIIEDVRTGRLTYSDMWRLALAIGRNVQRQTGSRETIGIMLPNSAVTVASVMGMFVFDRVPAMMNYTAGPKGLALMVETAAINLVITSRQFIEAAHLDRHLKAIEGKKVIFLEDLRASFGLQDKLEVLIDRWFRLYKLCAQSDPQKAAIVLFTSGSEGTPKGVLLSHHAILSNIHQLRAMIDFNANDKFFNALPLFHAFSLNCATFMPLLYGVRVFLYLSPLHARTIVELVYHQNATVLFGTSTFLGQYARVAHPLDLYRIRYVVVGGEKLQPEVFRLYFEKFGLRLIEGYGTTECGPVISLNRPAAYRLGTVGMAMPNMSIKVEPLQDIKDAGLLYVRGPNLMLGYYYHDMPGLCRWPGPDRDWYCTGDIVHVDDEGFISIIGRLRRFAKIAGEMISLEAVEQFITSLSADYLHGVIHSGQTGRGEAIILYTTDTSLTRKQLIEHAHRVGFSELALPREIRYVSDMPLLGSGKINYTRLSAMFVDAQG
ncbi:MAG: AMP-binding protein [Proteobacteria bacterium]|nr:AMP-binding protein [Pseudomonadota bacterium]MDE3208560.1 AMP-binding protein [Pseudomonadota bacterium]